MICLERGMSREDAEAQIFITEPFPAAAVRTHGPEEARELILDKSGAGRPARDAIDRRVIESVRAGSGRIIDSQEDVGGWIALAGGEAAEDGDGDGMPDAWERWHGLDPADPMDHADDADDDAYTNIEEYLNETDPNVRG